METQQNKLIHFLDVIVTLQLDGSLSHQVYHKKTHANRYIHAHSHHHPPQKSTILKAFVSRAIQISDPHHLDK